MFLLKISCFTGDDLIAGINAMGRSDNFTANGQSVTTHDRDNDNHDSDICAAKWRGYNRNKLVKMIRCSLEIRVVCLEPGWQNQWLIQGLVEKRAKLKHSHYKSLFIFSQENSHQRQ